MPVSARRTAVVSLAKESLEVSGRLRMRVYGTSMLPTIYPGSDVTIRRASLEEVQKGDVVLASQEGKLRLHRVIERRDGYLIMRGDNCPDNDPPLYPDELLGVLVSVESRPRFLSRARTRLISLCR